MFDDDQYELLDFGAGRKLERFGSVVLDRPSPSATGNGPKHASRWQDISARFSGAIGSHGSWKWRNPPPEIWTATAGDITLELESTESGHVGVFPEQAPNWDWIERQVRRAGPVKVLNLFAYTGGSTLAAAAAGAEVVHVDAAKSTVLWARRNARRSKLKDASIRWIVEDSLKFVRREVRRGNQYDAIILDPPSYGHGPQGDPWRLSHDLMPLIEGCARLTSGRRAFLLFTCHTAGFGPAEVEAILADGFFGHCQAGVRAGPLELKTADGRRLHSGVVARWPA